MKDIYIIYRKSDKQARYVGQADNALKRWEDHKTAAKAPKGSKTAKERINADSKLAEYGIDNYDIYIAATVSDKEADQKEHDTIAEYGTLEGGWNEKP